MLLRYIKLSIAFLIMVHFMSCGSEKPIWSSTYEIEKGHWSWDDAASFKFHAEDTTMFYDLFLEIETMKDYPYQNLYTKVKTIFPKGDTTEQILSFDIYNKFGVQNGDCSKDLCQIQFIMQEKFRFKDPGGYIFNINQHLRIDSIQDIKSLTLKLFTVKEGEK